MFTKVNSKTSIQLVETLAKEIWHQHFTPLIGVEQVNYMLENFQSCEAITRQIENENYSYFLVSEVDVTLGYFAYYPTENYLYLSKFYLKQEARGRGVSKAILSFLEKQATALNLPAIQLNVFKGNDNTIEIYQKLGFEIIDTPQIDIGNGFILDDYVMKRNVN